MWRKERTRRIGADELVLVLTNRLDITADWLLRELQGRGARVLRLNTEDAPSWSVSWNESAVGVLAGVSGGPVRAESVTAVWYRRPGRPFGDRPVPDSPGAVLNAQWQAFFDGLLQPRRIRWVNDPFRNSYAELKMTQLAAARRMGLTIPETLITNDPDQARRFSAQFAHGTIIKAVDAALFTIDGQERFVFTRRFTDDLTNDVDAFHSAPVIIQRRIEPRRDIRATVVGEHVFFAEAQQVSLQDWRLEPEPVQFRPASLPTTISDHLVALVRYFGLRFAAIDLAITGEEIYFLELNPNGEWGWLQALGLPIAEALADELLRSD